MKPRLLKATALFLTLILLLSLPLRVPAEYYKSGTYSVVVKIDPKVRFKSFSLSFSFSDGLTFVDITDSGGFGSIIGDPHTGGATYRGNTDTTSKALEVRLTTSVNYDAEEMEVMRLLNVTYEDMGGNRRDWPGRVLMMDIKEPTWGEWKPIKDPTCTEPGIKERENNVGGKEWMNIDPLGHAWDWDNKKVDTPATCTEKGQETLTCTRDASHTWTRDIAPLGHDWDCNVFKKPTCTKQGSGQCVCKRDPGHVGVLVIPALGHAYGEGKETKPATCTEKGEKTTECLRDASHKLVEEIPATCHKEGVLRQVCAHDASHYLEKAIPKTTHVLGPWEELLPPTKHKEGLRGKKCTLCGDVLLTEAIPALPIAYYYGNTVSSQGFRFRDERPELTKKWYMFTPVDLSREGEQTIPLIASNMFYLGKLKLTVAEGQVTAAYTFPKQVKVHSEFLTFFESLETVEMVEPEELAAKSLPFGEPVSIQEVLGGDTRVLLYTHFLVDYDDGIPGIQRFYHGNQAYLAELKTLRELLD